jgi:hypothetical protein
VPSWYDAWADRYEEEGSPRAADVAFYVGLARDARGPLVELAVGTGRVAVPVARETGRRVIGIDSSSGLHLPTWADRRRCFERVASSLRPGGRFAWNAFAFDHHIAAAGDGLHHDSAPGIPVPHAIRYSVGDNRADMILDEGGTGSLWWATKNEWLGLIDVAGLRLEALYGGFAGEPFNDGSREYVFVARRGLDAP